MLELGGRRRALQRDQEAGRLINPYLNSGGHRRRRRRGKNRRRMEEGTPGGSPPGRGTTQTGGKAPFVPSSTGTMRSTLALGHSLSPPLLISPSNLLICAGKRCKCERRPLLNWLASNFYQKQFFPYVSGRERQKQAGVFSAAGRAGQMAFGAHAIMHAEQPNNKSVTRGRSDTR